MHSGRVARFFIAAFCIAWYFYKTFVEERPWGNQSDFTWYYMAAGEILRGWSPFAAGGYIYPPLLAFLLAPVAALPYAAAQWVWHILSFTSLSLAGYLIWRHLGGNWSAFFTVAVVWAFGGAAEDSLGLGQVGCLLTLLITIACTRTDWLRSWSIALGVAIKIIPGVLAVLLVLQRQWRSFGFAIGAMLLLTVLPWAAVSVFLSGPKAPARSDFLAGTPDALSWSAPSIALRIYDHPDRQGNLPRTWSSSHNLQALSLSRTERLIAAGTGGIVFCSGFLALLVATRGRLSAESTSMAGAALVTLALVSSPVGWYHYQVMQYPSVALLAGFALQKRLWGLVAAVLVCGAFAFPVPAAVLRALYHQHEQWPNLPMVMYFWTSIPAIASLALYGLFLRQLRTRAFAERA